MSYQTLDILVRTTQLVSIRQAFIQTGKWLEVDESRIDELDLEFHSVEHGPPGGRYHEIQIPHVFNYYSILVESEFHPNGSDRSVRPYMITDGNIKFARDQPTTPPSRHPPPSHLDTHHTAVSGLQSRLHRGWEV
ncbi:hypothetical protein HOY82DRAFT_597529 [Tuber indicum]|nr:hypothetical protein HOY82DRAFT_597529 [Tuber indicum]